MRRIKLALKGGKIVQSKYTPEERKAIAKEAKDYLLKGIDNYTFNDNLEKGNVDIQQLLNEADEDEKNGKSSAKSKRELATLALTKKNQKMSAKLEEDIFGVKDENGNLKKDKTGKIINAGLIGKIENDLQAASTGITGNIQAKLTTDITNLSNLLQQQGASTKQAEIDIKNLLVSLGVDTKTAQTMITNLGNVSGFTDPHKRLNKLKQVIPDILKYPPRILETLIEDKDMKKVSRSDINELLSIVKVVEQDPVIEANIFGKYDANVPVANQPKYWKFKMHFLPSLEAIQQKAMQLNATKVTKTQAEQTLKNQISKLQADIQSKEQARDARKAGIKTKYDNMKNQATADKAKHLTNKQQKILDADAELQDFDKFLTDNKIDTQINQYNKQYDSASSADKSKIETGFEILVDSLNHHLEADKVLNTLLFLPFHKTIQTEKVKGKGKKKTKKMLYLGFDDKGKEFYYESAKDIYDVLAQEVTNIKQVNTPTTAGYDQAILDATNNPPIEEKAEDDAYVNDPDVKQYLASLGMDQASLNQVMAELQQADNDYNAELQNEAQTLDVGFGLPKKRKGKNSKLDGITALDIIKGVANIIKKKQKDKRRMNGKNHPYHHFQKRNAKGHFMGGSMGIITDPKEVEDKILKVAYTDQLQAQRMLDAMKDSFSKAKYDEIYAQIFNLQ